MGHNPREIVVVERVTKTQIILTDGSRHMIRTGYKVGEKATVWNAEPRIAPVDDRALAALARNRADRALWRATKALTDQKGADEVANEVRAALAAVEELAAYS